MPLPALFISHGSPKLLIDDTAARDFLRGYAATLPKPRAIVIASAHFGTSRPAVVGDAKPGMIYDFGGMPELRRLVYPAPATRWWRSRSRGSCRRRGSRPRSSPAMAMTTAHGCP